MELSQIKGIMGGVGINREHDLVYYFLIFICDLREVLVSSLVMPGVREVAAVSLYVLPLAFH